MGPRFIVIDANQIINVPKSTHCNKEKLISGYYKKNYTLTKNIVTDFVSLLSQNSNLNEVISE